MSLLLPFVDTDAVYTEEEEWSDEFDDDADEASAGVMPAKHHIRFCSVI